MRRRDKPAERQTTELPPELAVGRCIEVWADDPQATDPPYSAWRNWSIARHALGQELPRRSSGAPWSLAYCDREYGPERADQRLRAAGLTRADIPALRRSAQVRLSAIEQAER